jgi:hypothetical protein
VSLWKRKKSIQQMIYFGLENFFHQTKPSITLRKLQNKSTFCNLVLWLLLRLKIPKQLMYSIGYSGDSYWMGHFSFGISKDGTDSLNIRTYPSH